MTRGTQTYSIRCLPSDFPHYTSSVVSKPQVRGYLVTPGGGDGLPDSNYVVAFDDNGVPVWWYQDSSRPINASFFGANAIGWWTGGTACGGGCGSGTFRIRNLSGAVRNSIGRPNAGTGLDLHDFQALPNGDYLGIQYGNATADLSSWGLSASAGIANADAIELNPAGQIVWSWSAAAHIDVASENVNWRANYPDVFHMNSVQVFGNQLIISFRHLDAVYDINRQTGAINWKLGGTSTPQSLAVIGNTYPSVFSGQHDARLLSDGTVTVHDNASQESGVSARAVRFQIDPVARTATVLESVTDPMFPTPAYCCGSANKLPGGDWLVSWGYGNYVAELTPQGTDVASINFWPYTSYRAAPVLASITALDNGMDARFAPVHL